MRTMYDGITASRLPADVQLIAGYLTGPYAWSAADWARFPDAVHVGIATQSGFNVGQVLDVEIGDATPTGAVQWVKNRRAAGVDPTVYCNASTWPAVRTAFAAAGVAEPHYWIAKYDDNPALPAGAVAKQHTNTAGWDESSVADFWPGVDPVIAINSTEDSMYTFDLAPGNGVRDCIVLPVDRLCRVTLAVDADVTLNAYGWVAPGGGNGYHEENVTLPDKGAHSFSPPKGTAKIDVFYSSPRTIHGVLDVIG